MTDPERLAGWLAVLLFTAGALVTFCKLRDYYYRRGRPDPLKPRQDDEEQYPMTRFSLRELK